MGREGGGEGRKGRREWVRREGGRERGKENCVCMQKLANWPTLLMKIRANLPILFDGRYSVVYVEGAMLQ